ncbi:sensor histidine kinase [Rufibacter roseus]|uniref:histidine kinase n=1 Tax=Rufibacter roseus TaxID=1567108 RepID=A0ABW2DUV2_9BACT|nr:ATP-binding protein [Rufibacter roseus]
MGTASGRNNEIEKLIELNEELENYFNNTIIPQLFVDADMILRKFTPAAMTQFSLSSSDLGKHIEDVANNIRFPTILDNIHEVIDSKLGLEKEIQTTDKLWYQMNILPYIIRKENRANGVIITFIDINDRILTLKGYEQLNKRYRNAMYTISHDLRGPLSNMGSLINILTEKSTSQEDKEQVLVLLGKSVEYLDKTIAELTEVEETDRDFDNASERVNFENLIEDSLLALKDKIDASGAVFGTEINKSEIHLPRKNVRSIVFNLLSNAIKYKSPDRSPLIRIKTEISEGFTMLSVSDNGIGIEQDKIELIFNRYTRLREDVEGRGVGLFIVKNMVEEMGGKIEVDSTLGEGSTFRVYFR